MCRQKPGHIDHARRLKKALRGNSKALRLQPRSHFLMADYTNSAEWARHPRLPCLAAKFLQHLRFKIVHCSENSELDICPYLNMLFSIAKGEAVQALDLSLPTPGPWNALGKPNPIRLLQTTDATTFPALFPNSFIFPAKNGALLPVPVFQATIRKTNLNIFSKRKSNYEIRCCYNWRTGRPRKSY